MKNIFITSLRPWEVKMYKNNPIEIEKDSMSIISEYLKDKDYSEEEKVIVKRMIHASGDIDYANIAVFKNNFVYTAINEIKNSCKIYTDTMMTNAGINKKAVKALNIEVISHINDEKLYQLSKEKNTTRSYQAIDMTIGENISIYCIGNAPTALYRILELYKAGKIEPKIIIGVPVGFVGAKESKEELGKYNIPQISTVGNKGGSNIAASIINALLYMVYKR